MRRQLAATGVELEVLGVVCGVGRSTRCRWSRRRCTSSYYKPPAPPGGLGDDGDEVLLLRVGRGPAEVLEQGGERPHDLLHR